MRLGRGISNRDFTAQAPNRLWTGDFTYLRCWEGVVYFSFVIDVFSRRVVGWQLTGHMRTDLVLDALRMALGLREPGADFQLVAHTDAGSQYTSIDYTQVLDDHEVLASIGSVGDAYDNALSESFVDSYKTELIADRVWRSRAQLELATVAWVAWFNHDRLHSSLGDIPPVEYEQHDYAAIAPKASISVDGSVAPLPSKPANGLTTSRRSTIGVDFVVQPSDLSDHAHVARAGSAQAAPTAGQGPSTACGLSALRSTDILADRNIKTNNQTTPKPT
jgi:hypothetical protein